MKYYISIGVVAIIAIMGGLFLLERLGGGPAGIPEEVKQAAASDWVRGPSNGKVVLIEYSDFQCPACGAYYPLVKQLEEAFPDDLTVVYRHFPLQQHKNAKAAAYAAEAAGKQGKFFEMHDRIFETQSDWSEKDASQAEQMFIDQAQGLGLSVEQFKVDMASSDVRAKVTADSAEGTKVGVNSTPTFYLNGEKLLNPKSFEDFKALIDEALKKSSTAPETSV